MRVWGGRTSRSWPHTPRCGRGPSCRRVLLAAPLPSPLAHRQVRTRLATWTKAVFLMLRVDPGGEKGGLVAVSTSQPIPGPPADARLPAAEARRWAARQDAPPPGAALVRHYDGGPLERGAPIAVACVPASVGGRLRSLARVRCVPPAWVYGDFDSVAAVVQEAAAAADAAAAASPAPPSTTINVVWGYGGWGGTQVLAEIGRGGWGLVSVSALLALRPDPALEISWPLDLEWARVVAVAKLPPRSEYSRSRRGQ